MQDAPRQQSLRGAGIQIPLYQTWEGNSRQSPRWESPEGALLIGLYHFAATVISTVALTLVASRIGTGNVPSAFSGSVSIRRRSTVNP